MQQNENPESQMYVYTKRRKTKEMKDVRTEVCSQSEAETGEKCNSIQGIYIM